MISNHAKLTSPTEDFPVDGVITVQFDKDFKTVDAEKAIFVRPTNTPEASADGEGEQNLR